MFFSFDYVIKEIENVAAVQPWSYGCTWEEEARCRPRLSPRAALTLLSCLATSRVHP